MARKSEWTAEERKKILAEMEKEGAPAVAAKHKVSVASLYSWKQQLKGKPAKPAPAQSFAASPETASGIQLPPVQASASEAVIAQEKRLKALERFLSDIRTAIGNLDKATR